MQALGFSYCKIHTPIAEQFTLKSLVAVRNSAELQLNNLGL